MQAETFSEKFKRKFIAEPFVPIGAVLTVGFLANGFRAFKRGDAQKAQVLMRGRVAAQAFTVLALVAGGLYQFNFGESVSSIVNGKTDQQK